MNHPLLLCARQMATVLAERVRALIQDAKEDVQVRLKLNASRSWHTVHYTHKMLGTGCDNWWS